MPTKKNYKILILFTNGEQQLQTVSETTAIELITEILIEEPIKKVYIEKFSS